MQCKQRCLHTAAWRAFILAAATVPVRGVQIPKFLVHVSLHYRGNYHGYRGITVILIPMSLFIDNKNTQQVALQVFWIIYAIIQ